MKNKESKIRKNFVASLNRRIFKDDRGIIENLCDGYEFKGISKIICNKGSVRADHFHKNDTHLCHLVYGKMNWYTRPVGSKEKPKKEVILPGQMYFAYEQEEHCMQFLEDSEFWCFSKLSRTQEEYEKDTVRLEKSLVDVYNEYENKE